MTSGGQVAAEFSRVVPVDRVGKQGLSLDISAEPAERRALAERFGIVAVDGLAAHAELRAARAGAIRAKVRFAADVVQSSVVTLEPVASHIEEDFTVTYAPDASVDAGRDEVVVHFDEEDPPEPIVGGRIDIGEMVAQHLALALDPYPREPGLQLDERLRPDAAADQTERPFAVLAKLRKRD